MKITLARNISPCIDCNQYGIIIMIQTWRWSSITCMTCKKESTPLDARNSFERLFGWLRPRIKFEVMDYNNG